jgi:hypothetical protein
MKMSLFCGLMLLLVLLAGGCVSHDPKAMAAPLAPVGDRSYPYRKPLTSLGSKFGALPPPVQNAVRAEAGMSEITEVTKLATADRVYYKISFRDVENFPPLYVASDGSVLNPDLTVAVPAPHDLSGGLSGGPPVAVTIKEVPTNVVALIHERAPEAEISTISKEIWGDHVVYLVSFSDAERFPKMAISTEGIILQQVR